jgi:hypothetical protein
LIRSPGSAHGQVPEIFDQQAGAESSDDLALEADVDTAQIDPNGDGAAGHAAMERNGLASGADLDAASGLAVSTRHRPVSTAA